jgi:cyclopropane fatty-acyl-phospholipid synthase-like methyltransferase
VTEPDYDPVAHYDRILAPWHYLLGDELHYGVFAAGDEPLPVATNALTQRMIDAADLAPGLHLLDVGCGSGAPACQLAQQFQLSVLGIATSRMSVQSAQTRAKESGLGDLASFEVRDGTDNQLPSAAFDRVWVLEASHLMRRKDRLLAESARVLRPDGRLVLCDIIRRREIPFAEVKQRRSEFLTLRAAFGDAHMESLENYTALAERCDLTLKQVEDLTALTLPTFARWRSNAAANHAVLVEMMGEAELATFVRASEILEGFWIDGTLGYGLISATRSD